MVNQTQEAKLVSKDAGGAFAGVRRRGALVNKTSTVTKVVRKASPVKKTTQRRTANTRKSGAFPRPQVEPDRPLDAGSRELMAPDEWDALLQTIEAESAAASVEDAAKVQVASDDLWEKLSSTRWIKTPPSGDHDSTLRA
jgi:hypothetical protein